MIKFSSTGTEIPGTAYRAAAILVLGLFISQASVAEDFSTLFDEDFKGVSLALPELHQPPAGRANSDDFSAGTLPGFPLSAEELSLVLKATNPVGGADTETNPAKSSFRERFVSWLTRHSKESADTNVFSTLISGSSGPGIHVDFDTSTEEVSLGYQFGF